MDNVWLVGGRLVTPQGVVDGALQVAGGRIGAIRRAAPRGAKALSMRGAYVSPGFIDLHVWGEPAVVARDAARTGTTGFLTTLGPAPQAQLLRQIALRAKTTARGAQCLGIHLEGPFVSRQRPGALPRSGMRAPTVRELQCVMRAGRGRVRLVTMAPELRGAASAIRWCRRHRIAVSLGHSLADAATAARAVEAGASVVTHVFNGMPTLHHRTPSLLDVALTDDRLTAMVIADGVHVSPHALRLLVRAKSPERVALVTDSIRHQGWDIISRGGAYYTSEGVLAGSRLTMIEAVRNTVRLGAAALTDAVRMAGEVPARALRLRDRGQLAVGRRADLTVFNSNFQVLMTIVNGQTVFNRGA
ncbi:MAG: N-acetylglucosamine-6-phosphate deacetylase [Candidatus Omnitrophica bacterium]|nr:N-acetylglucosamine-6-phosphate deacetylase [Candidatus Omnitrophota bacterium]